MVLQVVDQSGCRVLRKEWHRRRACKAAVMVIASPAKVWRDRRERALRGKAHLERNVARKLECSTRKCGSCEEGEHGWSRERDQENAVKACVLLREKMASCSESRVTQFRMGPSHAFLKTVST